MNYLIGDLQGCCGALERLLARIAFSPSRDRLWLLGDLVNRGPQSLATLRALVALGDAATCLLGNHDLHLLAVHHGARAPGRGDTLNDILAAPDRPALMDWLRPPARGPLRGRLADGARPASCRQWSRDDTLALAGAVEAVLRGPDLPHFLARDVRQRAGALGPGPHRHRTAALHGQRADAPALLLGRWRDGLQDQGRRGCRARGLHALVRRAGPRDCRHPHRLRPLVPRWACWTAPRCWGWTPAASGAAS